MKKNNKRKKIFIWSGVIIFIIIIILAISKKQGSNEIKVTTELAQKRTIIETVTANGRIQPEVEVKISPYISGEVVELYVKEGDEIKTGDLLAKIDPEIYISNFERMEASLNMQKANLANAKARLAQVQAQFINSEESYKRNKKLWEQNVISPADFDAAKSSYEVAKAEVIAAKESVKASEYTVSSSKASLKEAKENLNRTTIVAPNDGSVSRLNVEKGERVTGASQFSAGTEIMRIANLKGMEVNVEVNENDIVRISLNDTSIIEVDAYLNKKFKGIVTEIATSANITGVSADQVTNFEVKIRILSDSYKDLLSEEFPNQSPFRPGMSATVEIQTESANNILTVPIQSVTTRADTTEKDIKSEERKEDNESVEKNNDDELQEYVFLYDDGIAKLQKVKSGIQDNTYIEIISGLDDGQEVVTGPYRAISKKLKDGDAVKKVDKKKLFSKED
ncbi:MAG: efflux RND transporter periplasmic adaptor subunit [Bacteroidales bacterium]|nr:efflux RND transporter periplasmic adaptor subunit [Bacteroidales bacterium]